jgi:hypothetical protein
LKFWVGFYALTYFKNNPISQRSSTNRSACFESPIYLARPSMEHRSSTPMIRTIGCVVQHVLKHYSPNKINDCISNKKKLLTKKKGGGKQ